MPPSSASALAAVNQFTSSRPSAASIEQTAENKYGVSDLASQVSNLRNLTNNLTTSINNVDPSVTGRTAGSFVTEAQRAALVNRERQPLLTDLNQENTALNATQGDLTNARSLAGGYASALLADQNTKYQDLLNQYNAAVQSQQEAEKVREFNAQLAKSGQSSTDPYGQLIADWLAKNGGSSGTSQSAATPVMQQRTGGGFNFQGADGKAISAGTYATLTKTPIGTVLQHMGAKGDTYAQQAYNEIKNNLSYYNAHPEVLKSEFAPLFWGT